ncbi:C2 family cysteine protease [Actinomadura sp. 7K507]|uniref:C2 family cysteine protease n=1 Tax=Actinomadura sp. 7K507 TaxID=2530365 RepID=UPI00104C98E2|nr:C2 family cysteine protease [Actinomadura sp. 7K507]TDC82573.1 hypothetical protein E1285_30495 [Actinomadura sp. 7K507]
MGVEDTTKTDARTDTTDKPASSERPHPPPPDNPGSPRQPSRLESLARAREQQQSRSQQTESTDTASPPREERDDKATPKQTGSGNEEEEPSGKPETDGQDKREDDDRPGTDQPGRQDKREQEPRPQDEGTTADREPATGAPGHRDRPTAQGPEQQADTHTEPADKSASSERRWTPPPDNPGSSGQPSRLESLARAREQQEATAAQRSEVRDGRDEPSWERDAQPASAGSENGSDTMQAPGEPRPGEAGRADEQGEQPDPLDNGVPAGDQQAGGPGDRDRAAVQASEEPADTRAPDTDRPVDAPDDRDRRISGEGLLPDDNARVAHLDEDAVERSVADRLKQVVGKLDRSDKPKELADIVDRPDFQDPGEDPADVPDRYGTPLERSDGTRTPLFDGEPTREQTKQGDLGDCGVIASLGALAAHFPEVIRDCVRETDNGNYQVRLHEAKYSMSNRRYEPTGRPITLTVTSDLPVYDQQPNHPAFANSTSTGAAWAPVLEKALAGVDQTWDGERRKKQTRIWNARGNPGDAPTGYVRLNQGSDAGDRAELLTQLSGRPATVVQFPTGYDHRGRSADRQLREEITDRLAGNKPVLVGTRKLNVGETALPKKLSDGHVYEVTKVDDQGKLHLRNPWNRKHPEPMSIQEFKAGVRPRYTTLE